MTMNSINTYHYYTTMSNDSLDKDKFINQLREELENTKRELELTKEHLKKYTAPACKKKYYQDNKEEINRKKKEYKPTEEQKKMWARTAYLKKKAEKDNSSVINI
uniref:Uncharacterized protein n=1 Tax=viral metagenome TaxID=1070528 RepID=A0A6C0I3N7_9ZZZZ